MSFRPGRNTSLPDSFLETVNLDGQRSYPQFPLGIPGSLKELKFTVLADLQGIHPYFGKTTGVVPQYIIAGDDQYEYVDGEW
jgi:hypothetical protein